MTLLSRFGVGLIGLGFALALGIAPPGRADWQSTSGAGAFDVASVKPSAMWQGREGSKRSRIEYSPTSLTMSNVDLSECVQWAYGLKEYQIAGKLLPDTERYDIQAKTGEAVPVGRLRVLLQNLLASRFQLVARRDTKSLPVYEMVVAKGGPHLPAARSDAGATPVHSAESLPRVESGNFVFTEVSMGDFAAKLSLLRGIDLPVVDRTGIPGVYDITLKSAAEVVRQGDGPSLFNLIRDQTGLQLVAAKAPMEVLVVEHAAKPSAN